MRIGIDARYLNGQYSGIANYSENLLLHLAKLKPKHQFVVYVHPNYNKMLKLGDNFKIVKYRARPISLNTLFTFSRRVNEDNLDLLHSLFPLSPIWFKKTLMVTVHDLQPLVVPEFTGHRPGPIKKAYDVFYWWCYPLTIRRANWILTVSDATRKELIDLFPETRHKSLVCYEGLDEEFLTAPAEFSMRKTVERFHLPERYILYIGSTRPNKNLYNMVRAFGKVIKGASDGKDLIFILVVTPDRFFKDCLRLIEELRIEDNVRILSNVTDEEKKVMYACASALLFVSKNEGFGFPLIEAQSQEVPVITSNVSSLPEIGRDSVIQVDPDDVDQIAESIREVLSDNPLREELIRKGKENSSRFTWDKTARNVLDAYNILT